MATVEAQRLLALVESLAGGAFRFGSGSQVDAVIEMNTATFNRLASGRLPAEAALDQATIDSKLVPEPDRCTVLDHHTGVRC